MRLRVIMKAYSMLYDWEKCQQECVLITSEKLR